jgi:hypothetical protein
VSSGENQGDDAGFTYAKDGASQICRATDFERADAQPCGRVANGGQSDVAVKVAPIDGGKGIRDLDGDGDPDETDCNPSDAHVHKGATEHCDSKDNNCDGRIDEGCDSLFIPRRPGPPSNLDITLDCGISIYDADANTFSNWCHQPQPSTMKVKQPDGTTVVYLFVRDLTVNKGSTLQVKGKTKVILVDRKTNVIGEINGNVLYVDANARRYMETARLVHYCVYGWV